MFLCRFANIFLKFLFLQVDLILRVDPAAQYHCFVNVYVCVCVGEREIQGE